jgi:hypothetical protein
VIVVGVFLLVLVTPLQLAFNDMMGELRTRQAVATAQEAFNVANRSAVLGSAVAMTDSRVHVRLQVATNEPFSTADVERFEAQVVEQSGRPARLDLVQTIADIGSAGTLSRLLEERQQPALPAAPRGALEVLQEADGHISPLMRALPWPEGVATLTIRSTMGGMLGPTLTFVYLAEQELSPDAQAVLTGVIAAQTRMDRERITLEWLPATRAFGFSPSGRLDVDAAVALEAVRDALAAHPGLGVSLSVPDGTAASIRDAVARRVGDDLGLAAVTPLTVPGMDRGTAAVRLQKPGS